MSKADLVFFNTPARQKQPFTSDSDTIGLYTCGPTVYDSPRIGNWVAYIRWDILVRTLVAAGYDVNRVMNITDVGHLVSDADDGEDKMIKGARRSGTTAWDVAQTYTNEFMNGMSALGLIPPRHIVRATDFIEQQIALIQTLEVKGHTYTIDDGVYFDTSTFASYGNFARLDTSGMKAGARVDFNSSKRHISDFALWKFSQPDELRDMEWDSPWGKGFPGWHIECSAMAMYILGSTIDIHTGGIDHIPVHHTNEIAQSEAASGQPFARFWLHANFMTSDGKKISKSLGNGYTLDELQKRGYDSHDFKLFVLQSHYRSESNFSWEGLTAAKTRRQRLINAASLRWQGSNHSATSPSMASVTSRVEDIFNALADDLNTPRALSAVDALFAEYDDRLPSVDEARAISKAVESIDAYLGLGLSDESPDISASAKAMMEERSVLRRGKDYSGSDALRDELMAQGIYVRDLADGTYAWRRFAD